MSLKSFPTNPEDRLAIWCLDAKVIDSGIRHPQYAEFLNSPDLIVVQLPLSDIDLSRSPALCKLRDQNMLKPNQVLIFDEDSIKVEQKYLPFKDVVEGFLQLSLNKAHAYSRLFSVLGATKFTFTHKREHQDDKNIHGKTNLEGMLSKISSFDASIEANIANTISEIIAISTTYTQSKTLLSERIAKADIVMAEEGLEDDVICKPFLRGIKDGISITKTHSCTFSSKNIQSKNISTILNVGLKLPKILAKTSNTDEASFLSVESQFNMIAALTNQFDFELKIEF